MRATLTERRPLSPTRVLLWFSAPTLSRSARPGQFVMAFSSQSVEPLLGRPYWIHRLRDTDGGEEFALLVEAAGWTSATLATLVVGQSVGMSGPYGSPLTLASGVRNLLLAAHGLRVAPLIWLSDDETARGRAVTLLLGGDTRSDLYPLESIKPEVEVVTFTADGSVGERDDVALAVAEYAGWSDEIVVALPDVGLASVRYAMHGLPIRRRVQALLQPPMPCGTGLCGGCGVVTRRGATRLACRAGPAFNLRDIT